VPQNEIPDDNESIESYSADLSDEELLEVAHRRFKIAEEAWAEIRKDALDDIKFSVGEQWPDEIKIARDQDKRPCLTINFLPQYIHQITNDMRQNRQAMKVSPTDDQATKETAKVLQGLLRHIEYASNADTAYDTAGDSAVRGGFGFYRIVTAYTDPLSFDQEIQIKRVRNRFSILIDPSFQEPDGSDSNWGFAFDDVEKDDFKNEYPGAQMSGMDDWASAGNLRQEWISKDTCRVAEYYYKVYREAWIVQVKTPSGDLATIEESKVPEALLKDVVPNQRRKTRIPEIHWAKINGIEVLDKTVLPGSGKWIPIIPVLGDEVDVDGTVKLEGIVRHAKDPQRMSNYWKSAQTETIALAPRAPWIGAEGQFEGHEPEWAVANTRNLSYLEYKPTLLDNQQAAPPPSRNAYEPPVQAISGAATQAANDIKATTGIYDESLGNRSNAISGVAVQRRNTQSQTANFHFADNLSKSIRHGGRIIVDWAPGIYDTKRSVRILHPDSTEEIVTINSMFDHNGKKVNYDFSVGQYDVTLSSGPSFETKRQEAVQSIMDLMKTLPPQVSQSIADVLVENMDWSGADKVADRLKKQLPPGLQDNQANAQVPPQIQAAMQQLQQQNQMLQQHVNAATQEINTKKFELESKERIALMGFQTDIAIEHARQRAKSADKILDTEMANIDRHIDLNQYQQSIENQKLNSPSAGAPSAASGQSGQSSTGGVTPG
jgi:hypothetical protein